MYMASSDYVFSLTSLFLLGRRAYVVLFLICGCCCKHLARRCCWRGVMGLTKSRSGWGSCFAQGSTDRHDKVYVRELGGVSSSLVKTRVFPNCGPGPAVGTGQWEAPSAAPPAAAGFIAFGWDSGWSVRKGNSPLKVGTTGLLGW